MLTKQKISDLRALHQKDAVLGSGVFLAEGEKLIKEALTEELCDVIELICTENWAKFNEQFLKILRVPVSLASNKQIGQISNLVTPQEVLVVCKTSFSEFDSNAIANSVSVYVHELRDPGNAGTIIRIADWFGIKNVFVSPESVFKYNPKLVQSSMGSVFRIGYQVIQQETLYSLKGKIPLIATVLEGESVYSASKPENGLIMFGSESHGLPIDLQNLADKRITIPRAPNGKAESLNLAVSAGIILSHLL